MNTTKNQKRLDWTNKEFLQSLRKQIVLGSINTKDYINNLGVTSNETHSFFDGYEEYIENESKRDNIENLIEWANMFSETPFPESERVLPYQQKTKRVLNKILKISHKIGNFSFYNQAKEIIENKENWESEEESKETLDLVEEYLLQATIEERDVA